nr:BLUF domain-containing protein [Stenotrophomonas maltophilia]
MGHVDDLARAAARFNFEAGVTGVLLYDGSVSSSTSRDRKTASTWCTAASSVPAAIAS